MGNNRLIVALDVPEIGRARELVTALAGEVGYFKVGSQLFTKAGPEMITWIKEQGGRVFLDLKYHDIPNTVASAVVQAAEYGADIIDLHSLGGLKMMTMARERLQEVCHRKGLARPRLIGVTVLTSMDEADLEEVGIRGPLMERVTGLAKLIKQAALDGAVASPHEINLLRAILGESALVIVPGIRPAAAALGDQKRVATPRDALNAGASCIVVGRPIVAAEDPPAAARAILAELS